MDRIKGYTPPLAGIYIMYKVSWVKKKKNFSNLVVLISNDLFSILTLERDRQTKEDQRLFEQGLLESQIVMIIG